MGQKIMPAVLMSVLVAGCLIIILTGFRKVLSWLSFTKKKQQSVFTSTLTVIILWVALLGVLAIAGFFRNFSLPPRPVIAILVPLIIILYISFSKKFVQLLKATPPHWLVFIQTFRIGVELLLWLAFTKGLLPKQMTLEGRNFDIISGVLGLITGFLILQNKTSWKKWAIIYNIIGLGLLLNILIIAMLSMPTPFHYFMNEPASTIVADFPFIYLPGVLVVIAFAFHIFSLRQVWLNREIAPDDSYRLKRE